VVAGAFEWADTRTLRFTPAQALPRASAYDVALGQEARAQDGASLDEMYRFRFSTTGFLEVGQVIPADGAQDVQADSTITVLFNRPVVPLAVVEQQGNAPQPLAFEPPIAGQGEWLASAIYVFQPAAPLIGGTTYTGRIAANVQDVDGNPLQSEYSWRFTIARPQVIFILPQPDATQVSPEPQIQVHFNQQIDPSSARSAFHVRSEAGAEVVGTLVVVSDTLLFTPTQRLEFDHGYRIVVDAGMRSISGASMAAAYSSGFHTVPLPRILSITPADGDQHVDTAGMGQILMQFNAPIDPGSVMDNILMTPPLSPTQVYTSFNTWDNTFGLVFEARPSTAYAVHIGPKIADPYGNTIGQTLDVHFRTNSVPPMVQLVSSNLVATYDPEAPARVGLVSVNTISASLSLYRLAP
ncbi:MAG TPA: Ig-like domain-containing protein, partial [Roseiflexaceae bacterium]|nr:Ig-like domain-containing protein [Roseiflexaceae bacterium]